MPTQLILIPLLMTSVLTNPLEAAAETGPTDQCRFIGIHKFDDFTTETATNGDICLLYTSRCV